MDAATLELESLIIFSLLQVTKYVQRCPLPRSCSAAIPSLMHQKQLVQMHCVDSLSLVLIALMQGDSEPQVPHAPACCPIQGGVLPKP